MKRKVESAFCKEKRNVDVGGSEVKQGVARDRSLARFLRSNRKPTDEVRPVKQPMRSWQHFALLALILAAGALRTESDVHATAVVDCANDTRAPDCGRAPTLLAGR